jgi:diphthine-ammonia ligase
MAHSSDDKYAVLWSGGKDSCLALWRGLKSGLHISGLVNFFDDASDRVRFHGVRSTLIAEQARALDLELFQVGTKPDSFTASFEATLHTIKARGYTGVIAGDLHLEDVRKWNQERAAGAGLRLVEPLWHVDGLSLLRTLTGEGFRAVLTCCEERWGNPLWPGREIDNEFINDVSQIAGLDVCGERGEYHSFVFDGPIFSRQIPWNSGEIRHSNGFSQIDLVPQDALALSSAEGI